MRINKHGSTFLIAVCVWPLCAAFGADPNAPAATNATAPVSAPQPAPPVTNPLSPDVEALIQFLQRKYVNPAQVAEAEMNKAAVQGIVAALKPGAEWVGAAPAASTNGALAVRSDTVATMIGYAKINK